MAVPTTGGDTVSGRARPGPVVVAGSANPALADAIARELGTTSAPSVSERFPDGEAHVALGGRDREDPDGRGIRGGDVYVVQSTGPPVDANLMELALLADACWREDAARVTAVVPYFGYARQDRRPERGEAVAVRMVAEIMEAAAIDRVLVVDPHTPALESVFGVPLEAVSALPVLVDALSAHTDEDTIVVAPDLGAVKLAERVAGALGVPAAFVRKSRLSGTTVETSGVVGDVAGRRPVLVDDMISTGGTLVAASEALEGLGVGPELVVAAPHGLFVGDAPDKLASLPLRQLLTSDTLPVPGDLDVPHQTVSVAGALAEAIMRMHREEPMADLSSHG